MQPLARFADFGGRSRRSEYWGWQFVVPIVCGALIGVGLALTGSSPAAAGMAYLAAGLWCLVTIIPSFAVAFRRMHDTNRSAAWLLIGLVPVIGWIVLLIFLLEDGTRGPNNYGADPKLRTALAAPMAVTEVHHYHHDGAPAADAPPA